MPPGQQKAEPTAACHYVPGAKEVPQFKSYNKEELEAALARVAAASGSS